MRNCHTRLGRTVVAALAALALGGMAHMRAQTGSPGVIDLDTLIPAGTDDITSIFQSSIAALGPLGGTIQISRPGIYKISSPLVVDNRLSIRIECLAGISNAAADYQTINFVYTPSSGSLISAHGTRNLEISHCNLAYSHPDYVGDLIDLQRANGVTDTKGIYLHDNRIGGLSTTNAQAASLIRLHLTEHVVIERNMFLQARVAVLGPSDSYVNANRISIRDNWFNGLFLDTAIRAGGSAWEISGNVFEPKDRNVLCGALDTTSAGVMGLYLTANWIGDGQSGTCVAATGGPISGGWISGNIVTGGATGINLGNSNGVVISGNRFGLLTTAIDLAASSDVSINANSYGSIPANRRIRGELKPTALDVSQGPPPRSGIRVGKTSRACEGPASGIIFASAAAEPTGTQVCPTAAK